MPTPFASILLATSLISSPFETTDWLSVLEESDVIAVVWRPDVGDVTKELKVVDGIKGVARRDVIRVGAAWHASIHWPMEYTSPSIYLLFAANKPYDLTSIALHDALPILVSGESVPSQIELTERDANSPRDLVGGANPTLDDAAALIRSLLKADDVERGRLLLSHYLLRAFECGRSFELTTYCALVRTDASLDELLGVSAAFVREHGKDTSPHFLRAVARFAGPMRFRATLEALGPEVLRRFDEALASPLNQARANRISSIPPPKGLGVDEIRKMILSGDYGLLSLADVERFAKHDCDFMVETLRKAEEPRSEYFRVDLLALALATGRACSPCPPSLVKLSESARTDWAALAPTACSNAGQIEKLFTSRRLQRLKGEARFYYFVWQMAQGHTEACSAAEAADACLKCKRTFRRSSFLHQGLEHRKRIVKDAWDRNHVRREICHSGFDRCGEECRWAESIEAAPFITDTLLPEDAMLELDWTGH